MESLIDQLTSNPVLLAVVIVLAVLILFSVMKKLVKLMLVAVAVLALYLGYLAYTGKEVPTTTDELKENLQDKYEEGKEVLEKKVSSHVVIYFLLCHSAFGMILIARVIEQLTLRNFRVFGAMEIM